MPLAITTLTPHTHTQQKIINSLKSISLQIYVCTAHWYHSHLILHLPGVVCVCMFTGSSLSEKEPVSPPLLSVSSASWLETFLRPRPTNILRNDGLFVLVLLFLLLEKTRSLESACFIRTGEDGGLSSTDRKPPLITRSSSDVILLQCLKVKLCCSAFHNLEQNTQQRKMGLSSS